MSAVLVWLQRFESLVAAIAYAGVAGLLLGEIVAREIFSSSIWGSQRIAVFCAIVAGFLGLSLATGSNGHLRPQFADNWFPARMRDGVVRFGDFLSAVTWIVFAVIAAVYVTETYESNEKAAVLYWLLWPLQLVLPYAFASCGVRHFIFGLKPELKPEPMLME